MTEAIPADEGGIQDGVTRYGACLAAQPWERDEKGDEH